MILGVDHIALSCEDVVTGADLLAEAGFRVKFVQEGLVNHPAKKSVLHHFASLHAVAYCQAETGVSLELTQHAHPLAAAISRYQVLFNRPPAQAVPFEGMIPDVWKCAWQSVGYCDPKPALWPAFHAQFWYESQSDQPLDRVSVGAILLSVRNLSAAEKFWVNGLGCRVVDRCKPKESDQWTRIAFRGPIQAWSLNVILVEQENMDRNVTFIDDAGFPCLALLSNRLLSDTDLALKMGGRDASDFFEVEVGEKMLRVVILRGPDNELVEFIEIGKQEKL